MPLNDQKNVWGKSVCVIEVGREGLSVMVL